MIKLLKSLLQILTRREKKQAIRIILLDIIISLLDIGFLILLLYVIRFYANESANSGSTYYRISVFKHYPLLLIILFFLKQIAFNEGGQGFFQVLNCFLAERFCLVADTAQFFFHQVRCCNYSG